MTGRGIRIAIFIAAGSALSLLLVPAAGVGGSSGGPAVSPPVGKRTTIRVNDNFFDPRSTGVAQDGRVIWSWRGSNRHNVVFTKVPQGASRKGASGRSAGRWKRTFPVPGLYRYVCRYYAGMRGTITVKAPPLPKP